MSAENDAVVVWKTSASILFNLASKPSTRLLVIASSSAGEKSPIVTSFAVADIGANKPNAAGAITSFWKAS